MIDRYIQPRIMAFLEPAAARTRQSGLGPRALILFGFMAGIAAIFCAALQIYAAALLLLVIGRSLRTLSVVMAQPGGFSKKESYADTVCDFTLYGGFVFLFGLGVNGSGTAAAFLLFSYLLMAVAFFAGTLARNEKKFETAQGGIIERTEMFVFMVVCCVYPALFPALCAVFGLLCITSAMLRLITTLKSL